MKDSIIAAILNIKGVTEVIYVENKTWACDYTTLLPPMSFRVAVKGGRKKAIAKAIWENKIMGVMSCGDTDVTIKDSFGCSWGVRFQRIPKDGY